MATALQSGKVNFLAFGDPTTSIDMKSGGVLTSGNTSYVHSPHQSGYWMSFRTGRSINGITTLSTDRYGDTFASGTGGGNCYLIEALQTFGVSGTYPIATVAEGSGNPTENALDVAYIQVINGFDRIPNYALTSPLSGLTTRISTQSGLWSSGTTWSGGTVPLSGEIVRVYSGNGVIYDISGAKTYVTVSVENYSSLKFWTSGNTQMIVQNLQVRELGTLCLGESGRPVASGITAVVQITDVPVNSGYDPNQYGNGLVVLGTLVMNGQDRGLSFIKAASGTISGQTSVDLWSGFANWLPGDRLFVPDTRQLAFSTYQSYQASQSGWASGAIWEIRSYASGTGNKLYFNSGLTYQHAGPYGEDTTAVSGLLWHLANLSRNVIITSQNASGTPGHFIKTGHAKIDVRNSLVFQMGRTIGSGLNNTTFDSSGNVINYGLNQIGRYPVHFHHCGGRDPIVVSGNNYQFVMMGNVVDGGDLVHNRKWGYTVHGTHWGLLENNVAHNTFGAAFVCEDGSETNNLFQRNMAARATGLFGREDSDDATTGFARQGVGYWCRSHLSQYVDNVSTDCGAYGLVCNAIYLGFITVPTYPGAHQHNGSVTGGQVVNGNAMGISQFDGLECYGYAQSCGTWWWLNSFDDTPYYVSPRSPYTNLRIWHTVGNSLYQYPSCNVTLDRCVFRGDYSVLAGGEGEFVITVWPSDYITTNFILASGDFEGCYTGFFVSPYSREWGRCQDTRIRAAKGVKVSSPGSPGAAPNGVNMRPSSLLISGCDLAVTTRSVGGSPSKYEVEFAYSRQYDSANFVVQQDTYYSRSGVPYRLYYKEQSGGNYLQQSSGNLVGCPVSGKTNLEAYVNYQPFDFSVGVNTPLKPDAPNSGTPGMALAGRVAPSGVATASWTNGYVEGL